MQLPGRSVIYGSYDWAVFRFVGKSCAILGEVIDYNTACAGVFQLISGGSGSMNHDDLYAVIWHFNFGEKIVGGGVCGVEILKNSILLH